VEALVEGLALARTIVSHATFAQFQYVRASFFDCAQSTTEAPSTDHAHRSPSEIVAKDVEHEYPQTSSSNYLRYSILRIPSCSPPPEPTTVVTAHHPPPGRTDGGIWPAPGGRWAHAGWADRCMQTQAASSAPA
jgi:hypothetical protein